VSNNHQYKQGTFTPRNREKYIGRYPIKFKSNLELRVCMYIDNNPCITDWKYEPFPIKYISPIDGKEHTYWPDFLVSVVPKIGENYKALIEVKPTDLVPTQDAIDKMNKRGGQSKKKYQSELMNNMAKFKEGELYCKKRRWKWVVWTERDILSRGMG
jgi:hypothetical protein